MPKISKFIIPIVAGLFVSGIILAAPSARYEQNVFPFQNNTYDLGTSSLQWSNVSAQNAKISNLTDAGGNKYSTSTAGTGSISSSTAITAGYFPFWANADGGLSGTSSLFFATSGNNLMIGTTTPASSTALLTIASSSNILTVLNNGNVGIGGTSTPAYKLQVNGDIHLNGVGTYLKANNGSNLIGLNNQWNIAVASGPSSTWSIGSSDTNQSGYMYTTGSYGNISLGIKLNSGIDRFLISSTGNIGIGTASTTARLTLAGLPYESPTTSLLFLSPTSTTGTTFALSGGSASGTLLAANPVTFNGDFINFQTNSSSVFKVSATGTTQVFGSLLDAGGNKYSTSTANGSISSSTAITAGYFPFWNNGDGGLAGTSSLFFATSGNNLMIGTTSPASSTALLTIASSSNILTVLNTGRVGIGTNLPLNIMEIKSVNPQIRFNDIGSAINYEIGSAYANYGSAGNMEHYFIRNVNGGTDKIRISGNGGSNIGIGNFLTTQAVNPNAQLDVEGSGYILLNSGNVGIGTATPSARLTVNRLPESSTNSVLLLSNATSNLNVFTIQGGSASGTLLAANPVTFNGDFINFQVNSSSKFNVGLITATATTVSIGSLGAATSSACLEMVSASGTPEVIVYVYFDTKALMYSTTTKPSFCK